MKGYFETGDFCVTEGVKKNLNEKLEKLFFSLVLNLKIEKDYLQIFEIEKEDRFIKITHRQEFPFYEKEYLFKGSFEKKFEKLFLVDNGVSIVMMLSSEY